MGVRRLLSLLPAGLLLGISSPGCGVSKAGLESPFADAGVGAEGSNSGSSSGSVASESDASSGTSSGASSSGGSVPSTSGTSSGAAPTIDAGALNDGGPVVDARTPVDGSATGASRGFPTAGPWVSFYGDASGVDLAKVATSFRIINVDVDPGDSVNGGNFTNAQIQQMRAGGQNRVLSYLNLGSCENFRSYYSTDPAGHKSCVNSGALTTTYAGYPDEKWANLANAAYQDLIVNYVAARLAARGIDGFYLDNLEVVEHGANASDGPCDATCSQGGLDLVWQLRQKFPNLLIVMQNATSDVTRLGTTHGVAYPSILDGIAHEEIYSDGGDSGSQSEMLAWKKMQLTVNGRPFWFATEDYVGSCSAQTKAAAEMIMMQSTQDGFSPYVTDASGGQDAPCFWGDFP